MIKITEQYAKQLHDLKIPRNSLVQMNEIFASVPELKNVLWDPTTALERKNVIIDTIFPAAIRDFMKIVLADGQEQVLDDILEAYDTCVKTDRSGGENLSALLTYVTAPLEQQKAGIEAFIRKKFEAESVTLDMKEDKSLISGFTLRVGNVEYDWSQRGRMQQLKKALKEKQTASQENIISILKEEISDFDLHAEDKEIGIVTWVGDGIATLSGVDHAQYGEILIFDNGLKGMVQDIKADSIGCILFGRERDIVEGTRAARTGKRAGIPVGNAFLGRVVDALGAPIDGKGEIKADEYRPIENEAPGIVERKSVNIPMETGILSIDSMFPIGRGQRELIIGDRQTGKTSIATDTIINQKGKDTICIYVAIGQKASTIAKLAGSLEAKGAMDYTIIVNASASDPAPLQYVAPYAGTALAEYFMYQGRDVLIVYDDLSKHAVAYRAISLLLERPPGREAYPGDVFYLHSRLLERCARISPEAGGGSITALPIIETQAGDVSAYIPTNVISITDGQIFLESDLFNAGMRPAVNVGLSVSRVGGAAQTKAMKKAAGSIRIDLAQYREMEVFTQFSSDLDDNTKQQLAYGKGLMQLLKQPLGSPLTMPEQVITLVAATNRCFVGIAPEKVKEAQTVLLEHFRKNRGDLISQLETGKVLTEDLNAAILGEAKTCLADFSNAE